MEHSAWLQDHTTASALKGKTPYKMGNKRKPNLGGWNPRVWYCSRHKRFNGRKAGCWSKKDHFMGYDTKSDPQGTYKALNEGLIAAITAFIKEMPEDDKKTPVNTEVEPTQEVDEGDDSSYELPPDIALIRCSNGDPKMLDEVLCGPNTKEWQEALQYEINQLEKFNTWIVTDLPSGQMPIPCSEVVRVE